MSSELLYIPIRPPFLSHHVECGKALGGKGTAFPAPVAGSKQYDPTYDSSLARNESYAIFHRLFFMSGTCFLMLREGNNMLTRIFCIYWERDY
jgi:hypothetical protein